MELEIENTEVVSTNNIQIEAPGSVEVVEGEKDYKVSVVKKEYTIIGDSIFIPSMYEDAPPWLKEFIDTTLEVAITNRDQSLIDRMEAILTLMDYVPKNQYTEQINQIVSEDGIINSRIATLNSNLTDAISSTNATVAEINLTYASKNEAAAIATNVLTASLSGNGEIGSALIQLQEAYADLESTTAQSISMLESVMEGEINGNATAMETIRTYVGIDEAGASTGTGLSGYLEGSNGVIGEADSQLVNDIKLNAEVVESKFEYNSNLKINGINYNSGFGLVSSLTQGVTNKPTSGSEFWVKANKFKLTADNGRGSSYVPFEVNGSTGDITFRGKVTFGSNQSGTIEEAIASTIESVQVGDKNINITDNLIPITSMTGDINHSGYQFVGTPTKSNQSGTDTYSEPQVALDGADEVYSPYVDEMFMPYYFRYSIKGVTDLSNFKIVEISGSTYTQSTLVYTLDPGKSIVAGEWYIIDGIINPTGGSTGTNGSIRRSNGEKIGKISNIVLKASTDKLSLGWVANCTISRMKLSKITADTIIGDYVTQEYVDTSSTSTISYAVAEANAYADLKKAEAIASASGNSAFQVASLQNTLKSLAYKDSVSKAQLDNTIINGGYIQTNLVRADSIYADSALVGKLNALNITAGSVAASNITATNGFITNAMIADGQITNAKIGNASIDYTKIIDGNITNAKIGYASIDTLKIQGEAVTANRFVEGTGSSSDQFTIYIYYTPLVTHGVVFLTFKPGDRYNYSFNILKINGSVVSSSPVYSTTLYGGVNYTISLTSQDDAGSNYLYHKQLLMLGAKR